jgi:hypothetical protein
MVIVPPKGDNGIGDQVNGFLDDFFIESAVAAGLEPTETATATSLPTDEIPTETATEALLPTPTPLLPTEVPTPTPVVERGTVRTEFARGEVMMKEELKVNVDWFYNMSDEELNKIVEGNLWSVEEYENDSRLRDKDGNILKNTEDLGWFFTKDFWVGGGLSYDTNFFNSLYLGTTLVKNIICRLTGQRTFWVIDL